MKFKFFSKRNLQSKIQNARDSTLLPPIRSIDLSLARSSLDQSFCRKVISFRDVVIATLAVQLTISCHKSNICAIFE